MCGRPGGKMASSPPTVEGRNTVLEGWPEEVHMAEASAERSFQFGLAESALLLEVAIESRKRFGMLPRHMCQYQRTAVSY